MSATPGAAARPDSRELLSIIVLVLQRGAHGTRRAGPPRLDRPAAAARNPGGGRRLGRRTGDLLSAAERDGLPVTVSRSAQNGGKGSALVQPIVAGATHVVYGSRFLTGVTGVLDGASLTDMETCYQIFERAGRATRRLPDNALVVTSRFIGSVRFYASRPTLVWDALAPASLDDALAFARGSATSAASRSPPSTCDDGRRMLLTPRPQAWCRPAIVVCMALALTACGKEEPPASAVGAVTVTPQRTSIDAGAPIEVQYGFTRLASAPACPADAWAFVHVVDGVE